MSLYTCEKHPGLPAHHDDCDGDGMLWSRLPLKTSLEALENSLCGAPALPVGLIQDAIAAHKLRAALKEVEDDQSGFLAFMTAELAKWPCCCDDGGHSSTPPMMWPELIACIVKRAVKDALAKQPA